MSATIVRTQTKLAELLDQEKITEKQAHFLSRVLDLINFDGQSDDILCVCKRGIEIYSLFGVQAFYVDGDKGFYYQYYSEYFKEYREPKKDFNAFLDEEIIDLFKRVKIIP